MSYLAASGVCLAALVGSVIYETRRMKKEAREANEALSHLYTDDIG